MFGHAHIWLLSLESLVEKLPLESSSNSNESGYDRVRCQGCNVTILECDRELVNQTSLVEAS